MDAQRKGEMSMSYKIKYLLPSLAVLSLVGAASVATSSVAFAADKLTTEEKAEVQKPIDHAEDRIKEIHQKLHITADQEPTFGKLADVMRDNAKNMSDAVEKHERAERTTSAIDDLKAYQTVADTHADNLKKLVPAFEALYDSLSASQKKEADVLFTHEPEHTGHKS
jgi:protein CpxP